MKIEDENLKGLTKRDKKLKQKFKEKPFFKQNAYSINVVFSEKQLKEIKEYCINHYITHTQLVRLSVAKYMREQEYIKNLFKNNNGDCEK